MFPGTGNITYHSTLTETIAFRFNIICAVTYVSVCQGSAFAGNQLLFQSVSIEILFIVHRIASVTVFGRNWFQAKACFSDMIRFVIPITLPTWVCYKKVKVI